MYNLCIFVDDMKYMTLQEKMDAADQCKVNNMELNDCINGQRISAMSGRELEEIRNMLIDRNKKIVLLNIDEAESDLNMIFRKASFLRIEYLKFSPDIVNKHKEEILKLADNYHIKIVGQMSGNDSENVLPSLLFDPLNFVAEKKHPYFHIFYYSKQKNKIDFLRIKDALYEKDGFYLPGKGNAEIKEMTSALLARNFNGYFLFSLYGKFDFESIISEFKNMLKSM